MKTLIWKELRENAKWAALALACLLLMELYALAGVQRAGNLSWGGITLGSETFLLASAFGCAAVGAALGALQILPELRRDQWATLLHRPVPRRVIFLGKVLAGLLLYLAATGLPLLVSVLWVATPGQFAAPFVPGLVLGPVSDVLLGALCYFAALLLSLPMGGWAVRGAIALGVIGEIALHLGDAELFLRPLLGSVLLAVAAWGVIQGAGGVRPWVTRLALSVALLLGLDTGLHLVALASRRLAGTTGETPWRVAQFSLGPDGSILVGKLSGNEYQLTDLQGRTVPREWSNHFPSRVVDRDWTRLIWRKERVPSRSSYGYVVPMAAQDMGPEIWYLLRTPRNYFAGYDKLSRRRIGLLDADGFKAGDAMPRPFAAEFLESHYPFSPALFSAGAQFFACDFTERRLTLLLDAGRDPILGATYFPDPNHPKRIAAALPSGLRIFNADGAPLFSVPYAHEPSAVSILTTPALSRTFVQYTSGWLPDALAHPAPSYLDEIDAQGRVIQTFTAPPGELLPVVPAWADRLDPLTQMPMPSLLAAWVSRGKAPLLVEYPALSHVRGDWTNRQLLEQFAMAAFLAGGAFLWARRLGFPSARTVTWVLATLAFGLPGLLAYRLAAAGQARVACPQCGRPRPLRAEACPFCREPWPAPALNGAEIFEPAL